MSNFSSISRRHFLRGVGATLALPSLEIMAAPVQGASPMQNNAPMRFITMFTPNGVYPKAWDVDGTGSDYKLSEILSPLEALKKEFSVISGLNNSAGGDHVVMTSGFLSGRSVREGKGGISLDQLIANHIGDDTKFKSIVLGTEPPRQGITANLPISFASTVSWSSPTSRVVPEINPRVAFDRLFREANSEDAKRQAQLRKSVVDVVMEDAKSLRRQASYLDKQKIDEYLESVRSVERQLEKTINPTQTGWIPPTKPSGDLTKPPAAGIPRDKEAHLKMMIDIMVLALWTDSSRVCTLMAAHGFSRQRFSFLDGVSGDHHGMSHHKEQKHATDQYTTVSKWYVEQYAYLLGRLKNIDEGGKSLLDNSVVLYGSSMKDGNGHKKDNLPIVIGGNAQGRLKTGQHFDLASQPLHNLHHTIKQQFGLEGDFNDLSANLIKEII
ncbi:DUF1552 domain-containing protein [Akkermansiaceae bacterium]|nr:DUF1552 domain-containing protein [Akkermansiaceae bacterium]